MFLSFFPAFTPICSVSQSLSWKIQCQFLVLILLHLWAITDTSVDSFSWLLNLFFCSGLLPWSPEWVFNCISHLSTWELRHFKPKMYKTYSFLFLPRCSSSLSFPQSQQMSTSYPSWAKKLGVIFDSPLFFISLYWILQQTQKDWPSKYIQNLITSHHHCYSGLSSHHLLSRSLQ